MVPTTGLPDLGLIAAVGGRPLLTALDTRQCFYVDSLLRSGEHLLQVIDDVLDFSKLDLGRLKFDSTVFSVGELMDGIRRMLAPKAGD